MSNTYEGAEAHVQLVTPLSLAVQHHPSPELSPKLIEGIKNWNVTKR